MVLGDNVFNMELNKLIDSFYSNNANSALLLHKVENPSQYGVAVVEDTLIIKLVEKPKEFVSDLIITGVYIFDKSIFMAIDNIKPSQRGELEITDAIQKQLETGGRVTYELIQGWWKDTGQLQDILEANRLMLDEIDCEFKTLPQSNSVFMGKSKSGKCYYRKQYNYRACCIADDTTITNSCIGPYTSIDKAVTVNDCEIDNCIILENAKIDGIHKRISGSLIGRKVQIKELHKRPFSHTFLLGDDSEIDL